MLRDFIQSKKMLKTKSFLAIALIMRKSQVKVNLEAQKYARTK